MSLPYTTHLRADGAAMADAVARDLDAHVPTCPAWNVAKLTIHTGQHHRWVADAVRRGGEPPEDPPKPGLRGDALVDWFRAGWSDLADLLDGKDDDAPAWTWSSNQSVGFWRRRTTLETAVHRWDAQNAVGEASGIHPALAADGVDEMLFVMIRAHDSVYRGPRLHATLSPVDAPARWTIDLEDGTAPRPARDAGDAPDDADPVEVRGSAEDLLLFLWGRRGADSVEIEGDAGAAAALLRWIEE